LYKPPDERFATTHGLNSYLAFMQLLAQGPLVDPQKHAVANADNIDRLSFELARRFEQRVLEHQPDESNLGDQPSVITPDPGVESRLRLTT